MALYFLLLAFVPLLGSFITEPAAMTLAALMLRDTLFAREVSDRLKYATLGVLFVNISIGGTLTPFAAPPVLMVAAKWNWDIWFMVATFGWKASVAVAFNAAVATWLFRRELDHVAQVTAPADAQDGRPAAAPVPWTVVAIHLLFLVLVVVFAHHPVVFLGLFLFFLGFTTAYQRHQNPLILREALLVAFFLSGLVVLGGLQQWWLEPVLMGMDANTVFFGATALTAITDNAALTYLGSLVEGLSPDFKTALVAGAVTGGGLTLIANAPNPAGASILKDKFSDGAIQPLGLLLAALPPTFVAVLAFRVL
jgi:Na+/H+ antiporter NhaD/arsenite permease-like protein